MNKQKNISAVQDCKENTSPISHSGALNSFYARLQAANGPNHPWTLELASIVSAHEEATSGDAILDGVDKIDLAVEILDDLLQLAYAKCAGIDNAGAAQSAILAARRYVGDVREQTAFIATGVAA